jgi:hypothetical protein
MSTKAASLCLSACLSFRGVAFPQGVVALQPASKYDERRDVVAGIVASLASTIVLGLGSPVP